MSSVNRAKIWIGIGLIALGLACIGVSSITVFQSRNQWTNKVSRAGDSIKLFEAYLPSGEYNMTVTYWALSKYPQYRVFDIDGNQIYTIRLDGTEEPIEWKSYSTTFNITNSQAYNFTLFGASPNPDDSSMRLDLLTSTYDYLYPFRYLFMPGIIIMIFGIVLVVIGTRLLYIMRARAQPQS